MEQTVADEELGQDGIPLPSVGDEKILRLAEKCQRIVVAAEDEVGDGEVLFAAGDFGRLPGALQQPACQQAGLDRLGETAEVSQHGGAVVLDPRRGPESLAGLAQAAVDRVRLVEHRQGQHVLTLAIVDVAHVGGELAQPQPLAVLLSTGPPSARW